MSPRRHAVSAIAQALVAAWTLNTALGIATVRAADAGSVRPNDDAMTCEQIATELTPYVQQIVPNIQALGKSQQQLYDQSRQRGEKRRAEEAMLTPLAEAGAFDPTGAAKRAYQAALMAQMAKERSEDAAFLNSPLVKQNKAQGEQFAAQAEQMQSNTRLQHLMQLAQQKRCDRK